MTAYTTLEDVKVGIQSDLFADDLINFRSEQRDAIDRAKERFCKRSGKKGEYQYAVLPDYRQYLWNAKMRFGKTLCAMQLMRELDVKRTLIITHRPVVGDSWLEAFEQVFGTKHEAPKVKNNTDVHNDWGFGMLSEKENVGNFYNLENFVKTDGKHYAFFISMQYIRLSELVNAKTQAKNKDKGQDDTSGNAATNDNEKLKADILNADWDLIIIDEAHEGTNTSLGRGVIKDFLKKDKTKMLYLSGTPFNLYEDFKEEEIFTWDYIAEQQAKRNWDSEHPGEKNPYAELPKMNIFTYDITRCIDKVLDQTGVFSFHEFFRVWTGNPKADIKKDSEGNIIKMPEGAKGRFVNESEVVKFIQKLRGKDAENNFPFSTPEYQKAFRHTLWIVPGVKEAKALKTLLKEDKVFSKFEIVNVAGNNDEEQSEDALNAVLSAISDQPDQTRTITISCGRLTTGTTVKPWSAVFYLKGGDSASTYMQTIFRVQSPWVIKDENGQIEKMKKECYVFDFAPDRTLKVVAETAKFSSMAKTKEKKQEEGDEEKTQEMRDKETVNDFIDLCPVVSLEGGRMTALDVNSIYKQLENVFIDRLVRKGFDDPCLYNQEELNKVNPEIINHIGENGGQAPDEKRKDAKESVDLSHMTPEQRAAWEEKIRQKKAEAQKKAEEKMKKDEAFKKQWESWSEEEREAWRQQEAERIAKREKAKEEREEFKKRMTNIRGIALRIPLLMYGGADAGDPKEDLTVENFTRKIKDESWAEFMPKGISKEDFNKIRKCFNATRFEEAGKKYRALTREADFMHVEERIKQITEIFSYFRNPDKETVLTPWPVVNLHMSDTIGGYCFYDDSFDDKTGLLEAPRFVDKGEVTKELFDNVDLTGEVQTKILEINSKTGLYPLYVTYSLYRRRLEEYIKAECIDMETVSVQEEQVVWDDIVTDNVYIVCNTPMAVGITRRTLFGFRQVEKRANIKAEQLIERASNDQSGLIMNLKSVGFWKGNTSKQEMKFNAIVGNPPYQEQLDATRSLAKQHFPQFIQLGVSMSPDYLSLITPARWFTADAQDNSFPKLREFAKKNNHFSKFSSYIGKELFPSTDLSTVCTFLWDSKYNGDTVFVEDFGERNEMQRPLFEKGLDIILPSNKLVSILKKVINVGFTPLNSITTGRDAFGIVGKNIEQRSSETKFEGSISIQCAYEAIRYYDRNLVNKNIEILESYKIFTSKGNGGAGLLTDGKPVSIIGKAFVAGPNCACTDSMIPFGCFDNIVEAQNLKKYFCTKFLRFLVGVLKVSQNLYQNVYEFVPIQNFTDDSDIQWNCSVDGIDNQLYQKYKLDNKEIEYIESLIKPME